MIYSPCFSVLSMPHTYINNNNNENNKLYVVFISQTKEKKSQIKKKKKKLCTSVPHSHLTQTGLERIKKKKK